MDMPGETFTHLHLFISISLAHPYSIEANTCKKAHFTDMTTKTSKDLWELLKRRVFVTFRVDLSRVSLLPDIEAWQNERKKAPLFHLSGMFSLKEKVLRPQKALFISMNERFQSLPLGVFSHDTRNDTYILRPSPLSTTPSCRMYSLQKNEKAFERKKRIEKQGYIDMFVGYVECGFFLWWKKLLSRLLNLITCALSHSINLCW